MTSKSKSAEILEVPSELRVRERIPLRVYKTPEDASHAVANTIAECIRSKPEKCVLGLATGSTPTGVYEELIRLHKEEGLSFANVITFNLDEYYPMEKTQIQSYYRYFITTHFSYTLHTHRQREIDLLALIVADLFFRGIKTGIVVPPSIVFLHSINCISSR